MGNTTLHINMRKEDRILCFSVYMLNYILFILWEGEREHGNMVTRDIEQRVLGIEMRIRELNLFLTNIMS